MKKIGSLDPFTLVLLVLMLACVGVLGYEGFQRVRGPGHSTRAVPAQATPAAPQSQPQTAPQSQPDPTGASPSQRPPIGGGVG
jgi:hypothetical protein